MNLSLFSQYQTTPNAELIHRFHHQPTKDSGFTTNQRRTQVSPPTNKGLLTQLIGLPQNWTVLGKSITNVTRRTQRCPSSTTSHTSTPILCILPPCIDYLSWLPFIRSPSCQLPFTTTFRLHYFNTIHWCHCIYTLTTFHGYLSLTHQATNYLSPLPFVFSATLQYHYLHTEFQHFSSSPDYPNFKPFILHIFFRQTENTNFTIFWQTDNNRWLPQLTDW